MAEKTASASSLENLSAAQRQRIEREWPLLSFHYGLSWIELAAMPRWLRRAYLEQIPELLRKQQIRMTEAASFAHMDKSAKRRVLRTLNSGADIAVEAPKSSKDLAKAGDDMGFAVKFVDAEGNEQ